MPPRRFVIGDIHGCEKTFRALLHDVIRLQPTEESYLLGDLIDRGPRSKGVLDAILKLRRQGFAVRALCGNHEEMLLRSNESLSWLQLWMINGGHATLDSFNVVDSDEIPHGYRNYLLTLPYYIILEDFVLVHACLNFNIPEPFTDTETMLWNRSCEVRKELIGGRKLICGHTPVSRDILLKSLKSSRIMLDNGCVYKGFAGLGSLAALELNSMTVYFQENID
jgi:serine/threonine protein phosphatase 1